MILYNLKAELLASMLGKLRKTSNFEQRQCRSPMKKIRFLVFLFGQLSELMVPRLTHRHHCSSFFLWLVFRIRLGIIPKSNYDGDDR